MPNGKAVRVIGIHGKPVKPLKRFTKELKTWQIEAVLLALQGWHNDDIADKFEVHAQTISNILRSKQALEIRDRVNAKIMKQAMDSVPETVKQIQVAALANMQRVLTDEKLQKASPMALFDKSAKALEVMSRINPATLADATPAQSTNVQVNNIFRLVEEEDQKTLHEKIIQSLSVAEVHSWVNGDSIDGTGSITSAARQLPSPEASGEGTEGGWIGNGIRPKASANQSEDGPVLSLNVGAELQRSQPQPARQSLHLDAENDEGSV